MSSRNGTLKRQHPGVGDETVAESSPPTSSIKKRRLEDGGSSSTLAWYGRKFTDALTSTFGRRSASGGSALAGKDKAPGGASYEIPDSDEDPKAAASPSPTKKPRQLGKKLSNAALSKKSSNIYDVPDSGDELELPESTPKSKRQAKANESAKASSTKGKPSLNGGQSGKRPVGRPRKQPEKAAAETQGNDEPAQGETPTKRRPGRPRKIQPVANVPSSVGELFSQEDLQDSSRVSSKLKPIKKSKRTTGANKQQQEVSRPKGLSTPRKQTAAQQQKNSTASKRKHDSSAEVFFEDLPNKTTSRRAVKLSRKAAEILADKHAGRGKAPRRTTKSGQQAAEEEGDPEDEDEEGEEASEGIEVDVDMEASDEEEGEEGQADLDMDIDEVEEAEEGDEEEDDEVCTICSKPDSKASNQILFCDSCDMAVHQKCYGVTSIPKGDWFCRNCAPPEPDLVQTSVDNEAQPAEGAVHEPAPDIPGFDGHLRTMQRVLLERCTGRRRMKPRGQDDAYEKTSQLIEQTVVAGEGNSMLVIGARGSGKTALVESILDDISQTHRGEFHVVRLNGFIHTDDKLAVKEIWQQLGKELEEEEEHMGKANSYADTMAYLLSLLSHPSEFADGREGVTSQAVIFVIDEFDLFATHGRQTLLYNLLDIAQAKKAPIAVLGLTTRIDVVESLEKRVKSRFSHRYVYLSPPKSVPAFWDICRQGLTINDGDMRAEGIDVNAPGHAQFWEWWNKRIDALYKTQSFRDHLEFHFNSTKSVPGFLTSCILPLSSIGPSSLSLKIPSVTLTVEPPDSNLHVLESLSDLDLALLICAARLDIVAHTDVVNFAMAYDEYTSMMGKLRVQSAAAGMLVAGGQARVWGRGVAAIAWERLVDLGLLLPAGVGARGAAAQAGAEGKMWKVDVVLEEIPGAAELNSVLAKWCKEI